MTCYSDRHQAAHDWLIILCPQVLAVTSVRRVSMETLQGAPVCADPAGPADVTATLTSAWREAAIAAAANVWSVWTTRGGGAVRPAWEVSTTAERQTPADVRTTFSPDAVTFRPTISPSVNHSEHFIIYIVLYIALGLSYCQPPAVTQRNSRCKRFNVLDECI